jgi:hypothetical protein
MAGFSIDFNVGGTAIDQVRDESDNSVIPPTNPPGNTKSTATIEIVQDRSFGGCWTIHQVGDREWWGWEQGSACPSRPRFQLSINGNGKINHVKYYDGSTWQSVSKVRNAPAQPSVTLTLTVEDDTGPGPLVTCYYIIQGGSAYRICRP